MLPQPSPGENKSRRVQKHVTSPNSGLQRLKRLPAEGWFLLAASFPLAALVTWHVTVPLLAGKFGNNPLEVVKNFFTGVQTLNEKLSICPSILNEEGEIFYKEGTITTVKRKDWDESILTANIAEPLIITKDRVHEVNCDVMKAAILSDISHWLSRKTVKWRDVTSKIKSPTEGVCVGGTFTGSSQEAKKLISNINLESQYEYKDGFLGSRETGKQLLHHQCLPVLVYQVCGISSFRLRTIIKLTTKQPWSNIHQGIISAGEILLVPPLSATFLQVESAAGAWLYFTQNKVADGTGEYELDWNLHNVYNISQVTELLPEIQDCLQKR